MKSFRIWCALSILLGIVIGQNGPRLLRLAEAACTNTTNLGLCKPALGDQDWAQSLNTNFDIIDQRLYFVDSSGNFQFPDPGVSNRSLNWNGGGFPAITSHGSSNGIVMRVATGNNDVTIFRAQSFAGAGEVGNLNVEGVNSTGGTYRPMGLFGMQSDRTAGSEVGYLQIKTTKAGTYAERLRIGDPTLTFEAITFTNLGTPTNGTLTYCSDCTIANPCASGGSGAFAKRLNGAWVCN
jgi:hypothetical protein